jgi:hypothetical protein
MPRISKKALAAQAKRKAAAARGWATRRGKAPCKPNGRLHKCKVVDMDWPWIVQTLLAKDYIEL